jgi:hypothetical protein
MSGIETEHLLDVDFELDAMLQLGATPYGQRVIGTLRGGTFQGPKLRGRVLPGGGDWALFRPDGTLSVDVRTCFETDDGALIYVTYGGRWKIPEELKAAVFDPETTETVDPSRYYLRSNPLFETSAERYAWLNDVVAIGIGRRTPTGISYRLYEIR